MKEHLFKSSFKKAELHHVWLTLGMYATGQLKFSAILHTCMSGTSVNDSESAVHIDFEVTNTFNK